MRSAASKIVLLVSEAYNKTYKGHIQNGAVVLYEQVDFPDGTPVRIELAIELPKVEEVDGSSFGERYAEVMGKACSLSEDAVENHDHYLYGVAEQ